MDRAERDRRAREALARVDPREVGFPVHEHLIFDRAGDGSVTVTVPWSDCSVKLPPGSSIVDCRRAFNAAYCDLLRQSVEEQLKVKKVMAANGVVPLSEMED